MRRTFKGPEVFDVANRNFDIIVLGDSLATRVAAISLAKKGLRVLSFCGARPSTYSWLFLSAALEDFLGQMGGRSCLTPPLPIQVITSGTRTEIHGPLPLADELKREFPLGYHFLQSQLDRLEDLGDRLEETVRLAKGLPLHGVKSRLRFLRGGFTRKIPHRTLNLPFQLLLDECTDSPSREFMQALMEGLSLTPAKELTQGEAALLWRSVLQPRSISASAFEAFLKQRFDQFHGETEESERIQSLDFHGSRIEGVTLKDGRRCTADFFLLGDSGLFPLLPPSMQPAAVDPLHTFTADLSEEKVSSLLASRVILAGNPLLRLNLSTADDQRLNCKAQALQGSAPTSEMVHDRLTSIFPFASFKTTAAAAEPPSAAKEKNSSTSGAFPGVQASTGLKKNLLNCCAQSVLPSLGSTGEVMLGLSCAHQIIRIKKL